MPKYILYHENSTDKPYKPQEDFSETNSNVFVVADGITHDLDNEGLYPIPSDAGKVARIICEEIAHYVRNKKPSHEEIKNAFLEANKKVREFNETRDLYKNRENNGYTFGAATVSVGWLIEGKLLYGVLDDCFISVFGNDYIDHPILNSFVEKSAKYLEQGFDWQDANVRKMWRKDIRNNRFLGKDNKEYGYGAIDGREGFLPYLQLGEVDLKNGDLVCVYTDGFIKMLQNRDLVKTLYDNPFTLDTFEMISKKCRESGDVKEKTGYFIKI